MIYVEAPVYYRRAPGDPPAVFLAGGITGVDDWQAQVVAELAGERCVVFNPRRSTSGPTVAAEQVAWEFHHLHVPRVVTMFWFPACDPAVTVQPIALFELGAASASPDRRIVVGADDGYPRRVDIVLQMAHVRPALAVHHPRRHGRRRSRSYSLIFLRGPSSAGMSIRSGNGSRTTSSPVTAGASW